MNEYVKSLLAKGLSPKGDVPNWKAMVELYAAAPLVDGAVVPKFRAERRVLIDVHRIEFVAADSQHIFTDGECPTTDRVAQSQPIDKIDIIGTESVLIE